MVPAKVPFRVLQSGSNIRALIVGIGFVGIPARVLQPSVKNTGPSCSLKGSFVGSVECSF